ncbi:uncharacterized protein LOC112594216 [Melanaphis sacchari]|uniref:uncharacterized protein LOC112594216 n=1 Tax=Melanaphis sacchari TaxID=742174 RepID=UPI000DC1369D|nr:uncharacterized protein LOC112594216 [Melanaphis sacchari]XP_025194678.1 uncharacterized protein LOC112594216 [Melanaphis sacchari]XP_025194679.1 uncharacterized protein LOC112594216 [Melanaphis sacchari]XP_025194681.1 uncharacterized protein LOC112594216 [Melanaphis sacchari]
MDLGDRRIRCNTPKIKCHEKKNNRKETYHWKTKGKIKCPDKGTSKIKKPVQINPLMTILMSSRPQLDQPTSDGTCTERVPLTSYKTVVLELPENLHYKPAVNKPTLACKLVTRKCIVPDSNKLKLSLRW